MALRIRNQLAAINEPIIDQVEFLQGDDFSKVIGLATGDLTSLVFFNNVVQPWTLVDGTGVVDAQVVSGSLYFHEVSGSSGNYSLRFRPNAGGSWRVEVSYAAGTQLVVLNYLATNLPLEVIQSLSSSFVK